MLDGLSRLSTQLGLSPLGEDLEGHAVAVRQWLEADGERCLLIFDNAGELDPLPSFLPATGHAAIVITTSFQSMQALGQAIPVEVFSEAEALAYLAERTGLADTRGARELAAELGHLPLALAQAAAVIREQRFTYGAYIERLRLGPTSAVFFISYRRDQNSFIARTVRTALAARFGVQSVFMDETTIRPGQDWPRDTQEAILVSHVMLVLIGRYWLTAPGAAQGSRRLDDPGDWVRREVEAGLARPELAVVPVLVDGANMPLREELPPGLQPLSDRQGFILSGAHLEREIDTLIDHIKHLGLPRDPPFTPVATKPARQGFWSRFRRR